MKGTVLEILPIKDTGLIGDTGLSFDGINLIITVQHFSRDNNKDLELKIKFNEVLAFKFKAEMQSRGFYPDSYNAIVQITKSDWIEELKNAEPGKIDGVIGLSHYVIFITDSGYYETIAKTYSME